jgi:2-polyprenyl-3-methyl-5-hydroxy-6-metoxy-1,4-benzoquinol methylase
MAIPTEIIEPYSKTAEKDRLFVGAGLVERARTGEMLCRHLPPPPARVLDVGGAAGVHALPLARAGYEVHLVDPVPRHVEEAKEASARQPEHPLASVRQGEAGDLQEGEATADAVLLLGPLYHLTERADRLASLTEARRVLRPGGVVLAAAISRFASMLDGLFTRDIEDPVFAEIVRGDLSDGRHQNPSGRPDWFTTAYFHRPEELRLELEAAGFGVLTLVGLEGPVWLMPGLAERWADARSREQILGLVRAVETEASFLGVSAHLLAVGRRPRA